MCEWFDLTIGEILGYLDQEGLAANTLLAYVTDNGWIQDPERRNRYAPRSKRSPYDMGLRTPLILNWPGTLPARMDTTTLVSSVDIVPTLLTLADANVPDILPGINLMDKTARQGREMIFAENYAHDFTTTDSSILESVVLSGPWKLIQFEDAEEDAKKTELYNLYADPGEVKEVGAQFPEERDRLEEMILNWRKNNTH
jgi:uncharacterized sulfatase